MANFFENVKDDVNTVEEELMGPSYKYYQKIASPKDMGMSSDGNLGALVKDAAGLVNYVELLVSGTGEASKTGKPLGDRYFLKTGAKCKDTKTGNLETRYLYINNIPTGQVPFVSSGMGMDFPQFKGLIPAVLEDMEDLNPFGLFKGFLEGGEPACQELTMETTPSSVNNNQSRQTEYVTVSDIKSMDPCIFSLNNYVNPVTNKSCREAFTTMNPDKKRDPILQLYLILVCGLGLLILYKFMMKKK
jgi:hypothetical protein